MSGRLRVPAPVVASVAPESAARPKPPSPVPVQALVVPDLAAQRERAERFGHRFEALPASVPAAPRAPLPIQRIIYKDKGKQPKNALRSIQRAKWYKNDFDDTDRAWAHHLHNAQDEHYTIDEAKAEIAKRKKDPKLETPPLPETKGKKN